jgi:hypothetical protein
MHRLISIGVPHDKVIVRAIHLFYLELFWIFQGVA